MKLVKPAGNYSIQIDDEYIVYESGSYDCILPNATGSGRKYGIFNMGVGEITVKPQTLETLHGGGDITVLSGCNYIILDIESQKWVVLGIN